VSDAKMRVNDSRKYPVRSVGIDDATWEDIAARAEAMGTTVSGLTRTLYRAELARRYGKSR
jgi:gamma-glutamylcysteine synthetase